MNARGKPQGSHGPAFFGLIAMLFFSLAAAGCQDTKPVSIGFSGCLTGRLSDLGLSGRNGVILAVEEQNSRGGIHGRPIELLIKDDRHDPETARRVDGELIDAGVLAIIGHMTSSMTLEVMPLINEKKMVLLSPTTSTHTLSGLDDYFIRVIEQSSAESDHLADYALKAVGTGSVRAVLDLSNAAYTEAYRENFERAFASAGGTTLSPVTFTTGQVATYHELAENLLADSPDALLIITSALDGAMICQQVRKLDPNIPILMAGWAHTPEFLEQGGEAVEGTVFSHILDPAGEQPAFTSFRDRYVKRFSRQPDFVAVLSYEAAQLLFDALSRESDGTKLKSALVGPRSVHGLQGDFSLDRFGDPLRRRFILTVHEHRYVTLQ